MAVSWAQMVKGGKKGIVEDCIVEDCMGSRPQSILKEKIGRGDRLYYNGKTTEESLTEEREQAIRFKAINYEETKAEYYEWFEETKSTHGKKITFSDDVEGIFHEDQRDENYEVKWDGLTHYDCSSRPSYSFAKLAKMWANTLLKDSFFERPLTKRLLEKITERGMDMFLDGAIEALKTDMIRLWGSTGGTVKFFKKDIQKFKDLKESWEKFNGGSEKQEEKIQLVKISFKFNPDAIEFKPRTIEGSLEELNRKVEKLLDCRPDYPICIATPL